MSGLNKSLEQDAKILFEIITDVTGVTQEQINNGGRKRNITDARMMMCESLRRNSKYTLKEIGSIAGGLDHSSIVYYRTKLVDICDVDREFKRKFTEVNLRFKQIKISGLPLSIRLNAAIEERNRLNKEIGIMKKKLKIYKNE